MINAVAHIGITVSDINRSIKFYRDVLKFEYIGDMFMEGEETERLFDRKGAKAHVAYLKPNSNGYTPLVELIEFTDVPSKKDEQSLFKTSISELCFYVDDIDIEYERLKELNVQFLSSPQSFDSTKYGFGKSRAVYLKDPDGNILELIMNL